MIGYDMLIGPKTADRNELLDWGVLEYRNQVGMGALRMNFETLQPVDAVIVATREDGEVIGNLRVDIIHQTELHSLGTWVAGRYRRRGIAMNLWTLALDIFAPKLVDVVIVSAEGLALIKSLRRRFPNQRFRISVREEARKRELSVAA